MDLAEIQEMILYEFWYSTFSLLTASRGSGKSQSFQSLVLTTSGFQRMGDLKVGDHVITPKGESVPILQIHPQGIISTLKVKFKDGRESICCKDHLWNVKGLNNCYDAWETVNTLQIKSYLDNSSNPVFVPTIDSGFNDDTSTEIKSIEASDDTECQCISIDDPDGLYITNDYVVTHNSFISAIYAVLQALLYPGRKIGIFAPSFRQAKLIFAEIKRIYYDSPFLQQCIDKPPTDQNDQCICMFKKVPGYAASEIKALPIGADGGKIRGQRFQKIILDEIVHINQTVFNTAIYPMMSNARNPMQRARKVEKILSQYGEAGLAMLEIPDNGFIGITSGFYQFNYWWDQIVNFYHQIKAGDKQYSLRFVPYWELPRGFQQEHIIKNAKLNNPTHMFQTEWEAKWISDSQGVFPMSLLESCRSVAVEPKVQRDQNADKGKDYIFGIDIGRERDSTAIVVMELGYPCKMVHLIELEETPFPEQARVLYHLIEKFNPSSIYMDAGGGGSSIRDFLAAPDTVGFPVSCRIIETDSELNLTGRRILTMCNFNPAFIEDSNNQTKTLLEQHYISLPTADKPIEKVRNDNSNVDLVDELIKQIASVVITKTSTGRLHYDLPKKLAENETGVRKKDLYTAFILAGKCIYDTQFKPRNMPVEIAMGVIKESAPIIHQSIFDKTPTLKVNYSNERAIIVPKGGIIIRRG